MTIKPISFAKGGKTEKEAKQEGALVLQVLASIGIDEDTAISKLNEIGENEDIETLSNIQKAVDTIIKTQNSPDESTQQAVQYLNQTFSTMFKCGGKIQKLVKKHSKGNKVDCGCGGTKIRSGAEGDKLPKQRSEDKTVTIIGMGTPEQVIKGTYDYPSTNGEFEFGRYGKTANVWDNTGGFPTRYADEEWIRRHPIRQMIPLVRRKPAPEGFFENLGQRVTNRFPDAKFKEGGIVEKGQSGIKTRQPAYSDSSIAKRLKNSITDRLGITQKPKGEPNLSENADIQNIRKGLNSQVGHLIPGISAIAYTRDAINDLSEVPQNPVKIIPATINLAAGFGLNAPFLRSLRYPIKVNLPAINNGPGNIHTPSRTIELENPIGDNTGMDIINIGLANWLNNASWANHKK